MAVVDELLALSDDGDPELLLDLIRLFLDDGPSKIATLTEGLRDRDCDKIERAAHSLKGSSGNLGARRMQHTCEQLQMAMRSKDLATAERLAPELTVQFDDVRAALTRLQQRYAVN